MEAYNLLFVDLRMPFHFHAFSYSHACIVWWHSLIFFDVPKVYHRRISRPDGSKGWCGGKDLASSAAFTGFFCRALLSCWQQARRTREMEICVHSSGSEMEAEQSWCWAFTKVLLRCAIAHVAFRLLGILTQLTSNEATRSFRLAEKTEIHFVHKLYE